VRDTGVEATHEDLAGKVLSGCDTLGNANENTCSSVTDCPFGTDDIFGHRSGVLGTAAAQTNNGLGVAGVCWGCQILPVKVLGDTGSGSDADVIQGILFARNYAINNPTKKVIINMNSGRNCQLPTFNPLSQAMQDAINLAWNSGSVIVAAAGNDGSSDLHCPRRG
jgi:thermitase